MAKYLATAKTRPCPVCDKTNGNCRITDNELVLCMTFADAYSAANHPDYRYTKPTKDGMWGIYAPRTDQDFDREKWLREVEARQVETAQRNQAALSVEVRDRDIKVILSQLSLSDGDRTLLHRRGFTDGDIEKLGYRSVKQWQPLEGDLSYAVNRRGNLNNPTDGVIIPIPYFEEYQALRLHNPQGRPKYRSFKGSHLKDGKFPIAVYGHELARGTTWETEGLEFKPALTSLRYNVPVIGHNGSNFTSSKNQVKEAHTRLNTQTVIIAPDGGVVGNPNLVNQYRKAIADRQSLGYNVLIAWWGQFTKADGDIDEVDPALIQFITPEEFFNHCQGSAHGKFKDWLGKQLKRTKPQGFGKPKIEGSEYDRDRRVETWLEPLCQGISVKDGSLMGDGKTHSVPELADRWLAENSGGKVWYLTPDHRNPTVKQIEDEFTDLFPRNKYGFYRDGQGKLVKGDKTNRGYITNGHCPSADLFPQLTTLGYDPNAGGSDNPICQACGHKEICSFVPGWYRNDRRATLQENKIRCHPDSLPSPGEYDYSKDLLVWDDFPFKPTKALTTTWGQLLLESDRVREILTPEQYQFLDSVLQIVKPLFDDNSKYGLSLASPSDSQKLSPSQVSLLETVKQSVKQFILKNIKQDYDPLSLIIEKLTTNPLSLSSLVSETYLDPIADTLTKSERKQFKGLIKATRSELNNQAIQESRENLSQVPPNALIHLLKFLGGESGIVPRFHRGKLHLTLNNQARLLEIMHAAKADLFLDATQSQEDLQLKTGFNKPLTVIRAKSDQPLKNVTITQIKIPGIASKNISETALGRVYAVSKELGKIDPNMPMIGHKAWLKMLNLDGHWFKDNRGSNDFIGRLNLALVGMPNPNLGAIQDEYLAVNGSLDGFEEYYQRLVNSEILQGVGRLRANRFPDQKFNVYALTPETADLSWLSEYGAKVIVKHSFEVSPDAGNERQLTLNKIIEAAANLTRDGLKVTQDAIAKLVGMTRQGVTMALNRKGITLDWIVETVSKILATEPYKDPLRDSGQNWGDYQAFREVFELDPVLIAQEMIEIIQDGGLSKLTEFLDYFPKALQGKLLMILWALLTPDPDPPPVT
jgi:hypothetical protein